MKRSSTPKPVLKWAGGKQAIAARLVGHFPTITGRYFEPFLGGASVLFTLQPQRAVVGDLNQWLLDTYVAIQTNYHSVANNLDAMINSREAYLRYRVIPPSSLDLSARAALLIYLNKTGFRGLFRVNLRGQFNVPYGNYQRSYYSLANLQSVANSLQTVEIRSGDFAITVHDATPEDFIYFDPPYDKQGGYADFNRYTSYRFRAADQERLAMLCRRFDAQGIRWAVSNSDTPYIRTLYEGFTFLSVANRREINLNSQKRGIQELLITNTPTILSAPSPSP